MALRPMLFVDLELELQSEIDSVRLKIPVERRMVNVQNPLAAPAIHAAMIASEDSISPKVDEASQFFAEHRAWPDLTPTARDLLFVRLLSLRASIYAPGRKERLLQQFQEQPRLLPQEWLGRLLREQWQSEGRDRWRAQTVSFEDDVSPELPRDFLSKLQ